MKSDGIKFWHGHGLIESDTPCWWEYKFGKVILAKETWHNLVKLKVHMPYGPGILFVGINPREILMWENQELS